MTDAFDRTFEGTTVLVTGHTGFKGSWLCLWLEAMGARVVGYSLEPPSTPSNFELSRVADSTVDVRGDVRDLEHLESTISEHRPEIVFHLAAQSIVLDSYQDPKETFDVNVGGTVNVLEAVRATESVKAVVCVTSDKCYENREWDWGYREIDRLGGHDPYSTSKAMAELAAASYRKSFFSGARPQDRRVAVASVRAGNVIGGGDWANYRLLPDCARAFMAGQPLQLRNPSFRRPWQHVLEPLSGYMWLGAQLLGDRASHFAEAWNFGPRPGQAIPAEAVVQAAMDGWGGGTYTTGTAQTEKETKLLRLDWTKAATRLDWQPAYDVAEAIATTMTWYRDYSDRVAQDGEPDMSETCRTQIEAYSERARSLGVKWAGG